MSNSAPPVVVFDCMTLLQATTSPSGPSAACLRRVEAGELRLVVSPPILAEVRDVLSRPRIRQRNPALDDAAVDAYLGRIATLAPPATDVPHAVTYPRDPKDEPYLDLAVHANAAFLVSFDNDLLDLMTDEGADAAAVKALAPRLTVLTPPDLLRRLRANKLVEPPT